LPARPHSPPRVLLVYNQPVLPPDHPDSASENDILETVEEVAKVLPPDRFEVTRLGYARDPRVLLDKLGDWRPEVVFNLFEGEADRTATEVYHAALLEWAGVPFTGSPAFALALGRDKVRSKHLFRGAGLMTAAFQVAEALNPPPWPHPWPAIVKPACQDASVGIDQGSVVKSQPELDARVAYVFGRYGGPVLVEEFIPGREFHVHVIDGPDGRPVVLPPTEIRFEAGPGYWPIYTYEGKWNEQSVEFKSTPYDTQVDLPGSLWEQVRAMCTAAYRLVGMRDYGRVDLRVTPEGRAHVLEVNPNPYLNSLALIEGLKRAGRTFPEFIQTLVHQAAERSSSGRMETIRGAAT
jgi:D-alanine-D-alanine ligase